jgi:hypothetical protein
MPVEILNVGVGERSKSILCAGYLLLETAHPFKATAVVNRLWSSAAGAGGPFQKDD